MVRALEEAERMQRSPTVFRVAASLCPMRIRSNTQIKRINVVKERAAQWERDEQR